MHALRPGRWWPVVRQVADFRPPLPERAERRPLEVLLQVEMDPSVRLLRTQPLLTSLLPKPLQPVSNRTPL